MSTMALFDSLYTGLQSGYVNVWAKRGNEKRSCWFPLAAPKGINARQALDRAQRWDRDGFDVYFGVCPSIRQKTGAARMAQSDVAAVPAYFLDCDTMEDPDKSAKAAGSLPADPRGALALLQALPLPPSVCVLSGHGLHAYWLLNGCLSVATDGLEVVKDRLRAFADAVARATGCPGFDTHASEPARVLRVPGTHNHKHGGALPVEQLPDGTGRRYDAAALDAWARSVLGDGAQPPASTRGTDAAPVGACAPSPDHRPGGRYYLDDAAIWAMLARRDERITRLRAGDWSGMYSSQSEADQALCNALAFATGRDVARVDALFRESGLYRPKWDEIHSAATGETYGEMTARKACADTVDAYRGRDHKLDKLVDAAAQRFDEVRAAYEKASGGAYTVEPFRTCAQKVDRSGNVSIEPLADFVAVPEETVLRDDGADQLREYVFTGFDYQGRTLPRVTVPAAKLDAFRWVSESWPGAVIEAGTAKRDKLRAAIQKAERLTATRRTVYSHSGWRRVNGRWAFLYDGGAVGAEGVSVELPGTLAGYTLQDAGELDCADLDAARASLALLDLAPRRVTVPLLASMYLAPLCEWFHRAGEPVNHVLILHGKTQSKKSVLASLFLNHFGTAWNFQNLPFNFQSTANAIREGIFLAKDLPAVVDDFHPAPTGGQRAIESMTQTAQALMRAWGDHAARQRMNADLTLRSAKPARGLGIFTAEYIPDLGESGLSRAYIAPLHPGDVDNAVLTAAQDAARRGVYAAAMRGFISWICGRVNQDAESFTAMLGERFRSCRAELLAAAGGYGGHDRLGTAGAHMLTGYGLMLEYFENAAAVGALQRRQLAREAGAVILEGLSAQAAEVAAIDPLHMFAEAVEELRQVAGAFLPAYYASVDGAGGLPETCCGIASTDGALYAFPKRLYATVAELCRKSGAPFPVSARELWKRLHEAGAAATPRADTQRVPGAGVRYAVRLDLSRLSEL